MATAKITRIEPANPATWKGQQGTMYSFEVELSDGVNGQVNATKPDRWQVDDEVEYTQQTTHHGTKLKLSKPGFGGGYKPRPGGGGSDDNVKGIIASWAVNTAMLVADRDAPNYSDQVMQYARLALEVRGHLKNEVEA